MLGGLCSVEEKRREENAYDGIKWNRTVKGVEGR